MEDGLLEGRRRQYLLDGSLNMGFVYRNEPFEFDTECNLWQDQSVFNTANPMISIGGVIPWARFGSLETRKRRKYCAVSLRRLVT